MTISDSLYGDFELEPVLAELLQTDVVQRLRLIHQGGANYLINPSWDNNRYNHSVGTMLLIRLLGGTLEEQIAGLLHDVSHTAFSHVVDYVFENEAEDFHEKHYEKVIYQSQIPQIMLKYSLDLSKIMCGHWQLLDQPLPLLCADRIDYTLRDLHHIGFIPTHEAKTFISSLTVASGQIVITDLLQAEWFTRAYYQLTLDYFRNPQCVRANQVLSEAIRYAYQKELITVEDFYLDDDTLLQKLRTADLHTQSLINLLTPALPIAPGQPDSAARLSHKPRLIDPPVLLGGSIIPASMRSATVLQETAKAKMTYNQDSQNI